MSHVITSKFSVTDLEALKRACPGLGLNFHEGKKTFKSWEKGRKCDHAISVKGKTKAYEIGVKKQGNGEYKLQYDPYQGGQGLMKAVGKDLGDLKMHYNKEASMAEINILAAQEGLTVIEGVDAKTGELLVEVV